MVHDFKKFPELTNRQMQLYYFDSPHKQITENFFARVVRVIDGDTVRVKWNERDFDFPVRLFGIAAPELNEGGEYAKNKLEKLVLNAEVEIIIDKKTRVGKWGRIIGRIISFGIDVNNEMINSGYAIKFENRETQLFPSFNSLIGEK